MAKKYQQNLSSKERSADYSALNTEYAVIKRDLLKVLFLNVVFLAAILSVYFTDQKTHYLVRIFDSFTGF